MLYRSERERERERGRGGGGEPFSWLAMRVHIKSVK
jgi:hypothetical protein